MEKTKIDLNDIDVLKRVFKGWSPCKYGILPITMFDKALLDALSKSNFASVTFNNGGGYFITHKIINKYLTGLLERGAYKTALLYISVSDYDISDIIDCINSFGEFEHFFSHLKL